MRKIPLYGLAANGETIPLEPAGIHAGRVYYPAVGGGGMHVRIDSRYPVTVAMAWADEWNAAMRPGAPAHFSFLCVKEHVTSAIYECHLPSERPMIVTFRDERRPERPILSTVGAMLGPGARQFISPNDLHIQYYNALQPEFCWRRILNEKYQITAVPKVCSSDDAGPRRPGTQPEDQVASPADDRSAAIAPCRSGSNT